MQQEEQLQQTKRGNKSEQTRQKILAAAEDAFSELGFYGARIDDIATNAHINKRMIYEYFGNKETLYKVILTRVYQRLGECESDIVQCADTLDAREAIRSLVQAYFEFLRRDQHYLRMIMWENLSYARNFDESMYGIRNPIKSALHNILRHGQMQGYFREDIDEGQVLMSLFSGPFNYFSNAHTMQRIMNQDYFSEENIQKRSTFIASMLLAYLEK